LTHVELLLQYGADVHIKSTCIIGLTPLHIAVRNDIEIVKLMLPNVKNINVCDNFGHSPLFYAIRDANVQVVDLLLSDPKLDFTMKDINSISPLNYAINLMQEADVFRFPHWKPFGMRFRPCPNRKKNAVKIVQVLASYQSFAYFMSSKDLEYINYSFGAREEESKSEHSIMPLSTTSLSNTSSTPSIIMNINIVATSCFCKMMIEKKEVCGLKREMECEMDSTKEKASKLCTENFKKSNMRKK
jgi:ankyrin repeat protein